MEARVILYPDSIKIDDIILFENEYGVYQSLVCDFKTINDYPGVVLSYVDGEMKLQSKEVRLKDLKSNSFLLLIPGKLVGWKKERL